MTDVYFTLGSTPAARTFSRSVFMSLAAAARFRASMTTWAQAYPVAL